MSKLKPDTLRKRRNGNTTASNGADNQSATHEQHELDETSSEEQFIARLRTRNNFWRGEAEDEWNEVNVALWGTISN